MRIEIIRRFFMETLRSFISFDIENELVIRRISEVQNMLANTGANLKFVNPNNIHVTLRFLGDISTSMIAPIHEELKQITFLPFEIKLKGLGTFPSLGYVRVVWAGIERGVKDIEKISNELEPRLRKLGFKSDPKGFSPHLTIARIKTGRNRAELIKCVLDLKDYDFGPTKADCLRLKRSVLTPSGPIYTTLREVVAKSPQKNVQ